MRDGSTESRTLRGFCLSIGAKIGGTEFADITYVCSLREEGANKEQQFVGFAFLLELRLEAQNSRTLLTSSTCRKLTG